MSIQPKVLLTPEEYLAIERQAEYKSEYSAARDSLFKKLPE